MLAATGSLLLAFCGFPEALRSFRLKRCDVGLGMLLLWLFGELFLTAFAVQTHQYILLINYAANIAFVAIMLYYKFRGDCAK